MQDVPQKHDGIITGVETTTYAAILLPVMHEVLQEPVICRQMYICQVNW